MPILLYCVANREVQIGKSLSGVAGSPVERIDGDALVAFAAHNPDSKIWLAREMRASALEFHRVLNEIFQSGAIIPFRFPTIFESDREVNEHLQEKSGDYVALLKKFADVVQMEIRVQAETPKSAASGTDYLKHRQNSISAVEEFLRDLTTTLGAMSQSWRQRQAKEGTRAFALVSRSTLSRFEASLRTMTVPRGLQVRVSGPWPATEFMEPR